MPIRDSYPVAEIWVLNTLGESVSLCNGGRMAAASAPWHVENILLSGAAPNRIRFFQGRGYIINSYGNSATVFDPETARVLRTIPFGSGHNPWDAAFRVTGSGTAYMLVSCFISDRVLVVDLLTESVVRKIPLAPPGGVGYRPRPEAIAVLGDRAFVTCTGWDFSANSFREGYLAVLDIAADDPTNWVPLSYVQTATNPQALLVNEASNRVHILCSGFPDRDDGVIQVYGVTEEVILTNILCGGSPHRFTPTGDGTVFLAGGSAILSYNSVTGALLRGSGDPLYSGGGGSYLPAAAWDAPNGRLFVADFTDDRLLLIATNTGAVLAESRIGDGPLDLVYRLQP